MRLPALLWLLLVASLARADDAPAPICTDRPTKSTGTCTAEAGHLQVETDLVDIVHSRIDGTTVDAWSALNPTLKYGVGEHTDLELSIALLNEVRTSGAPTARGAGDAWLKLKHRFVLSPTLEVALMPVLKAPTAARSIGNGAWEGGLLVPVVAQLSGDWSLNLSPEIDVVANANGRGHHVATAQLVNLGRPVGHDVTLSLELWGASDWDPAGRHRQASLDVGAAWLTSSALQFDGGVNLGLNRATPALQAYVGVSQRF
jgi:hypothetical protein